MPPALLDGTDDENYYGLLNLGLEREVHKRYGVPSGSLVMLTPFRQKLPQYNSIDDVVKLIEKSSKLSMIATESCIINKMTREYHCYHWSWYLDFAWNTRLPVSWNR